MCRPRPGPLGKSWRYESVSPIMLTTVPDAHPIANRVPPIERLNSMAITEGITRNENTSSTPAMATLEVMTKPKEA